MSSTQDDIWITDLAARAVGAPVSSSNVEGCWRSVPYRLEHCEGISLACNAQTHPDPVTIKLGVTGRYGIHLITKYPIVGNFDLRVRLSGDLCFESLEGGLNRAGNEYPEWWDAVEIYWKDAELDGQDLVLAPLPETWLWAVRLEPAVRTEPRETVHPYVFTDDGATPWLRIHTRKEDILEREALIPEDTCAKILIYSGAEFDVCGYPTEVGTVVGSSDDTPTNEYGANVSHNMKFYRDHEWNPLLLVKDYAKSRDWEFHVYVRLRALSGVYPLDGVFDSRFFMDHPEFHMRDKEGTHICGVSYAYPEVREHVLALFEEMLSFGVDGLVLCFVRGCPMVLYEPIMVKGFRDRYGMDPRELADTDERWLDYCAEINTDFMRQVKSLAGPGQRISGFIHGTRELNRRWAMDIPRWVREGLIDDCFIIGHIYDEHDYHWDAGPDQLDFEWFQNLPGRERVRLFPMLYPWDYLKEDPESYQKAFWSWLDAGADGYGVWDAGGDLAYEHRFLWKLGLADREPYEQRSRLTNRYLIKEINGFRHDRYSVLESW